MRTHCELLSRNVSRLDDLCHCLAMATLKERERVRFGSMRNKFHFKYEKRQYVNGPQ